MSAAAHPSNWERIALSTGASLPGSAPS